MLHHDCFLCKSLPTGMKSEFHIAMSHLVWHHSCLLCETPTTCRTNKWSLSSMNSYMSGQVSLVREYFTAVVTATSSILFSACMLISFLFFPLSPFWISFDDPKPFSKGVYRKMSNLIRNIVHELFIVQIHFGSLALGVEQFMESFIRLFWWNS